MVVQLQATCQGIVRTTVRRPDGLGSALPLGYL